MAVRMNEPDISEWELWACAQHYVRLYGEDAPTMAAMRSDELLAEGDLAGAKTFRQIMRKTEQLLRPATDMLN